MRYNENLIIDGDFYIEKALNNRCILHEKSHTGEKSLHKGEKSLNTTK